MRYACWNDKTHKTVGYSLKSKSSISIAARDCSPAAAAEAFKLLEGRWKLVIIHNLSVQAKPVRLVDHDERGGIAYRILFAL
jgi:DNA-binding HxlR family transcriptional regulator